MRAELMKIVLREDYLKFFFKPRPDFRAAKRDCKLTINNMDMEALKYKLEMSQKNDTTDANSYVWDIFWYNQYGMHSWDIANPQPVDESKYNLSRK